MIERKEREKERKKGEEGLSANWVDEIDKRCLLFVLRNEPTIL